MSDTFDPDERFSLYPLTGEEVAKRILDGEGAEEVSEEPEEAEGGETEAPRRGGSLGSSEATTRPLSRRQRGKIIPPFGAGFPKLVLPW